MTVACSPLSSDPSFSSAGIVVDVFNHDCNRSPSPTFYPSSDDEDDGDSDDEDEDEYNIRVAPYWQTHRHLFESRGYHLDTCKDVRQFYLRYWETANIQHSIQSCVGYRSACRGDDNELCKDEGLVSSFLLVLPRFPIGGLVSHHCWPSGRNACLLNYDGDETDYNFISGIYFAPSFFVSKAGAPIPW